MKRRLSLTFGVLIGAMWMGEVLLANLAGTSVFGNAGDIHPGLYSLARWFALSAVGVTALAGFVVAYRTRSIVAALQVGLWGGLISGVIAFVTIAGCVLLFHDAMMKDPSNVREFALGTHRAPSQDELSRFIYLDGFAGGVNHIWLGPLLGITLGGIGAVLGKLLRRSDEAANSGASRGLKQLTQRVSNMSKGGHSDDSNWTLQNCQYFALCGSRGKHIRRREILAGCRGNEPGAPPRRSPSVVRPSASRTGRVLFSVCSVRGISCLASGCAGKDNSSSHWCFGMGAVRVSTPWGLCELQ